MASADGLNSTMWPAASVEMSAASAWSTMADLRASLVRSWLRLMASSSSRSLSSVWSRPNTTMACTAPPSGAYGTSVSCSHTRPRPGYDTQPCQRSVSPPYRRSANGR